MGIEKRTLTHSSSLQFIEPNPPNGHAVAPRRREAITQTSTAQGILLIESEAMPDQKQLEDAAGRLRKLMLPDLQRPGVRDDEPASQELVTWSVRFYCYSIISHFREMLDGFLLSVSKGLISSSFVIARCLFEMAAHAHYVHKHFAQYSDSADVETAWKFLNDINMGSRYMREEYGELANWPSFAAPREIAKIIRCFDEWAGKGRATTEYSFLSEFAHPNMAALSHYYEFKPGHGGFGLVHFVDPPRDTGAAPWPDVSLSCIACLHFVLRMLRRTEDKDIAEHIESILVAIG